MAMGIATPTIVSAAGSRRVKASRAPRTSGTGSRTSRPTRASRDSRPRGGVAATAATGDTRPARQAGTTVATATVATVTAAARAIHNAGRGVSATGMPSGGPMNAGVLIAAHATDQPERGGGDAERGLLDQQRPHDLAGGEPERAEHGDVTPLDQHPRRGDVGDRVQRGDQRDDPEQPEQQPEQPVVARHRRVDLLGGGDLLDRGRLGGGVIGVVDLLHDLADGVGGRVGQPQAHDLLGLARDLLHLLQGGGQDPDQARGRLRVEVLVGGVGEADHGDRGGVAVDADDLDPHPHAEVLGGRERGLDDRAGRAGAGCRSRGASGPR